MTQFTVRFVNPYYTSIISDYVSVPYPTGERVELWCDGDLLSSLDQPGSRWPEMFTHERICRDSGITLEELRDANTQNTYE